MGRKMEKKAVYRSLIVSLLCSTEAEIVDEVEDGEGCP